MDPFKSPNLQIFKSPNLQIFISPNLPIFKSPNLQIFKSSIFRVLICFGNPVVGVEWDGVDVVFDDGAGVQVFDALEVGVCFKTGPEVANLHSEVGLVKDDVGVAVFKGRHKSVPQREGLALGVAAREGCNLDAVARNGAGTFVELDVFAHQLLGFLRIAFKGGGALSGTAVALGLGGKHPNQGEYYR